MKNLSPLNTVSLTSLCAILTVAIPVNVAADPAQQTIMRVAEAPQFDRGARTSANFEVFRPNPTLKGAKLDYDIWDEALAEVVIDLGPSTRLRAKVAQPSIGTRFVRGHKTPYRLEGSRFTFEYITDDYVEGLAEYRKDLQRVATDYDITKFSRDEQLAYWLNLYNVATIEKIAEAYPIQRPDSIRIEVDGAKYDFEDAPFLTVMDQKLSLNDIRENIVFRYWDNPDVIYGFFRGEIGSPILPRFAFTGETVELMLSQNADDFVNSLRGFNLGSRTRNVSVIYEEAAPYFFPNFEADLERHLKRHANETVMAEVSEARPFRIERYDNTIADLSAGRRLGSSGIPTNGVAGISEEITRLLREVREKRDYQIRNDQIGRRKGYVIIEDLVPEEDKVEQAPE